MHSERLSPDAALRLAFHREPSAGCPQHSATTLYRQRHKVENMFAKLKDWRRISMRYDRCAHTFFSAICIAATVIFWLGQ
jgi:transposase